MFLVEANGSGRLDLDAIRTRLEAIGVSVLVAGDARLAKVHVHSPRPDEVIAYGLTLGTLSRISVENLDGQARDVQERRAAAFVDDGAGAAVEEASMPVVDASAGERSAREVREARALGPAVVAVVAGGGLRKAFESFGVDQIVEGGQSANPSTGELLRIARLARAREVLVLPNNPNVRLAAEQAARMCSDKRIVVVPTRNAAEGLAAILALDPTRDAGGNAPAMTAAARAVQTFQVTEAVRDATIAGRKVKKGQTIVLDPDEGLIAAGGDRTKAVLSAVESLRPGFELVTLYYGDGADLAEAEAVARRIGEAVPGAEVEVVHGGQPHYRYLVAAE
jgi:dihydroxyacetone kinase-like predicted kinase